MACVVGCTLQARVNKLEGYVTHSMVTILRASFIAAWMAVVMLSHKRCAMWVRLVDHVRLWHKLEHKVYTDMLRGGRSNGHAAIDLVTAGRVALVTFWRVGTS